MFGLTAAPAVLFFLFMLLVPESPRWLAKMAGRSWRGRYSSRSAGTLCGSGDCRHQFHIGQRGDSAGAFFRPAGTQNAEVLVLGVVLAVFQQWCGINVIFNYAEEIFHAAGYDISNVLKTSRGPVR